MPFTLQASRVKFPDTNTQAENLHLAGLIGQVGDRCFIFYRPMIRAWRLSPRWTTAHEIKKKMMETIDGYKEDDQTAYELAWEVFFGLHVLDYERKKREENGEVE